jgi:small subunit ribosomal protein S5
MESNYIFSNSNKEFDEVVIEIKRVSKKNKGGNTIRFSALVVVGDKKGRVGVGIAKALSVSDAVRKATEAAKKKVVKVVLKGTTIPYSIREKFGASEVLLKPAPPGTGIIAGGAIRVVLEAAGVRDAVGKSLGSKNKTTSVYSTLKALMSISEIYRRNTEKKDS